MPLSRRASLFLLAVGVWTWAIWPNFMKNIAKDERAFVDGRPTSFFTVHLVLVVTSLAVGTGVGWIGWRGLRALRRSERSGGGQVARTQDGVRST